MVTFVRLWFVTTLAGSATLAFWAPDVYSAHQHIDWSAWLGVTILIAVEMALPMLFFTALACVLIGRVPHPRIGEMIGEWLNSKLK